MTLGQVFACLGGANFTPGQSDHLVAMAGYDTHFGGNIPYDDPNAGSSVMSLLASSGVRHVRDGSPGALPSSISQGIALGLDQASPEYLSGVNSFSETQCSVNLKLSGAGGTCTDGLHNTYTAANPNPPSQFYYIEMCGNEEDNIGTSNMGGDKSWSHMLAECVQTERGYINNYYTAHPGTVPLIVGPSLADMIDNTSVLATAYATYGNAKRYVPYANFHPGTGANNPGEAGVESFPAATSTSISGTSNVASISSLGKFFVTEFGFSDRKNTTLVEATCGSNPCKKVTGYIYNRTNGLPESIMVGYDLRSELTWYNAGASQMYFLQFADVPTDCTFGAQGFVTATLSAPTYSTGYQNDDCSASYSFTGSVTTKPEYQAIQNYLALFSDPGADFTVTNIPLTLTLSPHAQATVVEKRNGTVLIALWREEVDYNWYSASACTNGSSIIAPSPSYPSDTPYTPGGCGTTTETATVSLPGYTETRMDQFNADGSMTQTTSGLSNSVTLTTGYPVVLEYHT